MDLTAFNNLSDDEKIALLDSIETNANQVTDLTAERDSLREELTATQEDLTKINTELAETKKVNYTLARQTAVKQEQPPETILFNLFGGNET